MRFRSPKRSSVVLALLLVVLPFCAGSGLIAQSKIYSYVNKFGMKVITNIPTTTTDQALHNAKSAKTLATQLLVQSDIRAQQAGLVSARTVPSRTRSIRSLGPDAIDAIIVRNTLKYGLDPGLIRALIKAESDFDVQAVSSDGALGLMQLMPDTAKRYGVRNAFDPEENIAGGVHYLSDLLDMFNGQVPLALAAYNAGENLVSRIQRVPNYPETKTYIARIGRLFDMEGSPFLTTDEEYQPPLRMVRRPDGVLEITNLENARSQN